MIRLPLTYLVALVLCGLLALGGCVDQEKKKALADLQTTETALATTRATLETTQKERDALQKELQEIKTMNTAQQKQISELSAKVQASEMQREQLKRQITELGAKAQASEARSEQLGKQLATVREAAGKENEALKARIAALEKEVADRDAQIKSLQDKMAEMGKKLEATAAKPPEKPPEKPAPKQ